MDTGGQRTNPPRIKLIMDTIYHIYMNNTCIRSCLTESEFKKEMVGIKTYLELTNHTKDATLEYVECEAPTYTDASY
jgi:hypothetical protein